MRNFPYESTVHRQIREKREDRKERIRNDVERYGSEVLDSDEMKQAFEQKKWAFASDYIRLDVVHEYGGIYLDMDVELVKSLESLRRLRAFFSIDSLGWVDLGSGFGAAANNEVIEKLLKVYDEIEFYKEILPDGTEGYLPQPARLLPVFQRLGYVFGTDTQCVNNCFFLSPSYIKVIEDLTHARRNLSGKEYAIHWHNGAWKDAEWREKRQQNSEQVARCLAIYDQKACKYTDE